MTQITDTVLMVRPAAFGFNAETAVNNFLQQVPSTSADTLQQQALNEFDQMVDTLQDAGINVLVVEDTAEPCKPDAIFPNNWFCSNNKTLTVFPMCAASRRIEKRTDVLQWIRDCYHVEDVRDLGAYENDQMFLEGTGSMVMDHVNKIVYACLSPRTHIVPAEKFASSMGYRLMPFTAHDERERLIYHTNVMMCIGEGFAVFCPKSITDHMERIAVAQLLEATGHENIYISFEQMNAFAGNMLHLRNKKGDRFIVLSSTAFDALNPEQKQRLEKYGRLLPVDVSTIEKTEGGSVRCMMAEIFLEAKR